MCVLKCIKTIKLFINITFFLKFAQATILLLEWGNPNLHQPMSENYRLFAKNAFKIQH